VDLSLEAEIAAETPFEHDFKEWEGDADVIADQCAQMRALREGDPRIDEPNWHSMLGVLRACKDGERIAHEWSAKDERYDKVRTQGKLDYIAGRGYKPTTCEWFRANGQGRCDGCPLSVRSPISLGRPPLEPGGEMVSTENATPEITRVLPEGYRINGKFITKERSESEGGGWFKVCEAIVCVGRANDGMDKSFAWEIRNRDNTGWDRFTVPCGASISTPEIARRVAVLNDAAANAYIKQAQGLIVETQNGAELRRSFGWNADKTDFLLGSTIYGHANATTPARAMSGVLEERAIQYHAHGDFGYWQRSMMKVMGAIGAEASQFLVLVSAGAPFHAFLSNEGGSTVACRSHHSSGGKTTSLAAAGSIWGQWKETGNASNNTRLANQSAWEVAGNLPITFDDTLIDKPEDLRKFVMDFSQGMPRERLSKEGTKRVQGSAWSTFMLTTTNTDLRQRLATMTGSTEGPTARLFQLETRFKPTPDGGELFNSFSLTYGHAGPQIIGALLEDPGEVERTRARLMRANTDRMQRLGLPGSARFACRAITCAEEGGAWLKLVALPELDVGRIIAAAEETLVKQVENDKELQKSFDLVSAFLREYANSIISTGPNVEQLTLRSPIVGRYDKRRDGDRLFVPARDWAKWLAKHNKSELEAFADLRARGHKVCYDHKDLAEGTAYNPLGRERVIRFDIDPILAAEIRQEGVVVPMVKGKARGK
jgi:hypothetical protein